MVRLWGLNGGRGLGAEWERLATDGIRAVSPWAERSMREVRVAVEPWRRGIGTRLAVMRWLVSYRS
jgi:hypothetical protein